MGFVLARSVPGDDETEGLWAYLDFELELQRNGSHVPEIVERYTMSCDCEVQIGCDPATSTALARVLRQPCHTHSSRQGSRSPFYWNGWVLSLEHRRRRRDAFPLVVAPLRSPVRS